jgi:hypothetical protein
MDEPLHCPDCHELHTDPADAALGHRIRCQACDLTAALDEAADRTLPPVREFGLRPAA